MPNFSESLERNLPLILIAVLALIFLAVYFRSVRDRRGLEYLYELFKEKLTRERFYQIARLTLLLSFWLVVIILVLLVGNSMVNTLTRHRPAAPAPFATLAPRATIQLSSPATLAPTSQASELFFDPAGPEEILVVIVPFHGNGDMLPEDWIERTLNEEIRSLSQPGLIRVERYPQPIGEHSDESILQQIQDRYRPTITVWGWYDALGIIANYKLAQQGLFFEEYTPTLAQALNLPSSPDTFVFYVTRDLPKEITHLTFFEMSQIFYTQGKFDQALQYLQKATLNLPAGREKERNELLYLEALTYLLGHEAFDQTIQLAGQVLEADPNHFPAVALRGSAYLIRDIKAYIEANQITYTITQEKRGNEGYFVISSSEEFFLEDFASPQALADFERLVSLIPYRPEPYYYRAMQYHALGQLDDALRDLDQIMALTSEGSFMRDLAVQYRDRWLQQVGAAAPQ